MASFHRFLDGLEKAIDFVISIQTIVLVGILFVQVVNRYIFGISWPILQYIVPLCFVWLSMLGAAVVVRQRLHFEVDFLGNMLGPRGYHWHSAFVAGSIFIGGLVFAWTGWGFAELGLLKRNSATGYSMVYTYSALLGGGILICLLALEQMLKHIGAGLGSEEQSS